MKEVGRGGRWGMKGVGKRGGGVCVWKKWRDGGLEDDGSVV
jgi:hypothetical protein